MRSKQAILLLAVFFVCRHVLLGDGLEDQLLTRDGLTSQAQQWKSISAAGSREEQRECLSPGKLFGEQPVRVLATTKAGAVLHVDILFLLNASPPQPSAAFDAEFKRLRVELPERLAKLTPASHIAVTPDATAPAGSEVLRCSAPQVDVRLMFEPGRRVWMSLRPNPATPTPAVLGAAKGKGEEGLKSRVQHLPNGDVLIDNLPVVEAVETGDESARRVMESLQKYYDWKVDLEALWKRVQGSKADEEFEVVLARELAKELKVRHKHLNGIDLSEVKREVARGRLVVVLRGYEDKRQDFFREFAMKLKTDPAAELPSISDKADHARWIRPEDASYALPCIVHGYNNKRGEMIFSQPGWELMDQNLRMREEELQLSTLDTLLFFEP